MSANRIVQRRAWLSNRDRRTTYHQHRIDNGERPPSFQKRVRAARIAMGYTPTSSDMHHFEGKRC